MTFLRVLKRVLILVALTALAVGLGFWWFGRWDIAQAIWGMGIAPVAIALLASMARDIWVGRIGVDAIAFVSMTAALALGETLAGVVVAVMYAGGAVLEDFAVARAERDLRALIDRAPRMARRLGPNGIEEIPIESVEIGDRILVRAGEIIPIDGVIEGADASLDESAVTGEPLPVHRRRGEPALSGTVNAGETFEVRASALAGESTYAQIVRLVTAAQTSKAPFIRLADRYALLLLPVSLLVAGTAWVFSGDPVRGLAVLVAATPCPLILAAPVAFIGGVSRAARLGILIKGGGALEALSRIKTVMFDKTGTLTVGGARLIATETAAGEAPEEVLRLAASLEQASHHVVADAIVNAASARGLALESPEDVHETLGSGLNGVIGGKRISAGSYRLICGSRTPEPWALRVLRRASWRSALSVFVSVEGRAIGALLLGDELRRETPRAIRLLRKAGVSRIVMVTGDRADSAETIGAALDLDAVLADRIPSDKVDAVVTEQRNSPTLMVGDGINDAPALAAADVGVAMGARGASASSEAADVVILVDRLDRVAEAVMIARRARSIAMQSIAAGLALSFVAMGFAAVGLLPPVAGALTQEAIDIAVILNALRSLSPGRNFLSRTPLRQAEALMLRQQHQDLDASLDRLREIADALDDSDPQSSVSLIAEASRITADRIVPHEHADEARVYPRLARFLPDGPGLGAMSRAHREIIHLARLLQRLAGDLTPADADRYLIRDAQRAIEAIEALVRMHNAQEEDIYEHAVQV
ncbi:MAG: heavy metal translocating P-type ATPase [Beijerinckiaceae bacterium]|nr:heavy metal translocating P-type ATPase [Beijerinckiaceae bacterium]